MALQIKFCMSFESCHSCSPTHTRLPFAWLRNRASNELNMVIFQTKLQRTYTQATERLENFPLGFTQRENSVANWLFMHWSSFANNRYLINSNYWKTLQADSSYNRRLKVAAIQRIEMMWLNTSFTHRVKANKSLQISVNITNPNHNFKSFVEYSAIISLIHDFG